MNIKSTIHKLIVPVLVTGALLATAVAVQAASFKPAPQAAGGAPISALRIEKANSPSTRSSGQAFKPSAQNSQPQLMDDKGGQAAELKSGAEPQLMDDKGGQASELEANDDANEDLSEVENENEHPITGTLSVEFSGQLTAMNGSTWTVGGVTVIVSAATEIKDNPQVGSLVKVEGVRGQANAVLARQVRLAASSGRSGDDASAAQVSANSGMDDHSASLQNSGSSASGGGENRGGGSDDGGGRHGGGDDGSGHH